MELFKKIINLLTSPLIVLFAVFLLSIFIPWNYVVICISILFLFSIIAIIILKKWKKLFLVILIYVGLYIILFLIYVNQSMVQESFRIDIGNDKFYRNEIFKHTNLILPEKLSLIAKIDTIYHMGPGGSDYSAGCIYQVPKSNILKLKKEISQNKKFKIFKDNVQIPETFSFQNKLHKNKIKFPSVYISKIENCCTLEIAFDATNTRMYFFENYY